MPPWLKYSLMFGGGLFFLKLFSDSQKLVAQIRAQAAAVKPTLTIGGKQLPIPVGGNSAAQPVITSEAALSNANPSARYGEGYM